MSITSIARYPKKKNNYLSLKRLADSRGPWEVAPGNLQGCLEFSEIELAYWRLLVQYFRLRIAELKMEKGEIK